MEGTPQSFPHMYVILPGAHVEGFLNTEALKLKYKLKETKNHQDWSIWIFSLKEDLGSYWECYEVTESSRLSICRGKVERTNWLQLQARPNPLRRNIYEVHPQCIFLKKWFEKTSRLLYRVMIKTSPKRHQMETNVPEPLPTAAIGEPADPQ